MLGTPMVDLNKNIFGGILCAVIATLVLGEIQAQEPLAADETQEEAGVPYDPQVLRRIEEVRGPYTEFSDSPTPDLRAEPDATGASSCLPPSCSKSSTEVLVKLAPAQSAGQLRSPSSLPAWSKASQALDAAALTAVFAHVDSNKLEVASRSAAADPSRWPVSDRQPDLTRWYRMPVPSGQSVVTLIESLALDARVEVAEPIYERRAFQLGTSAIPSDPRVDEQWHLDASKVKEAWQWMADNGYQKWGDPSLVVAVIDSGVDYAHEDLRENMWVNQAEVPDNGVDDDGNGFVDDVHGVTVVGDRWSHSGDPQDDNGHGTHVAGIIAASPSNGVGISGVAPSVKIMAVKAAQYSGILTSTDIAEGIYYAYEQGADVINMSFGGTGRSLLEEEALAVAFGNAVLVASAGNQGFQNQPCYRLPSQTIYPAAYTYVLGVMAQAPASNSDGDWLANFSNWDCKAQNGIEYDLMAPGVDLLSTFPDDGYAAWDGTSMSAPVVSGLAALVRTRFSDRSIYSSRFVMGQVASTGPVLQAKTPCLDCAPTTARSADGLEALVSTPRPNLNFQEFWLWDDAGISADNDDDGAPDAGETVQLAVVIKNRWGQASNVQVTLSAEAAAAGPDPYVSWDVATVDYGSTGSFATDDNGLTFDETGLVTGVNVPFAMTLAPNTPNNHRVVVTVTMTASNGLDPDDSATYTTTGTFELIVRRGRELPSIIDSDAAGTDGGAVDTDGVEDGVVTLDDSTLWIVDKPVLVGRDVEVRFTEGADVQFWADKPDDAYAVYRDAYIQNEGTLTIQGSVERPVRMAPSDLFPVRAVVIDNRSAMSADYWWASNLYMSSEDPNGSGTGGSVIDHARIDKPLLEYGVCSRNCASGGGYEQVSLGGASLSRSRLTRLARENRYWLGTPPYYDRWYRSGSSLAEVLFENIAMSGHTNGIKNSVFLKNSQSWASGNWQLQGDMVVAGSSLSSARGQDWQLVQPRTREGRTYALLTAYQITSQREMEFAQAFAKSLGGNLLVINDDAEGQWAARWLASVAAVTTTEWTADYPFCATNGEGDTYCTELFNSFRTALGYARQPDGSYAWVDDEVSTSDYPAGQYYWDQPGGGADYPPKSPYLLVEAYAGQNVPYVTWSMRQENNFAQNVAIELPGDVDLATLREALESFRGTYASNESTNNAILNRWNDLNADHWLRLNANGTDTSRRWEPRASFAGNYWGGAGSALIDITIEDFSDDFNLMPLDYQPVLETAPEAAYPFVVDVAFLDADGNVRPQDRFAAEPMRWRVTFNRDMDTSTQPNVSFGPDIPYTDFPVSGDWLDARTWEGQVFVSPVANDGYQYARIQGAVAADDAWLITGNDTERFRFEVITSGTESLNLQAQGGVGYIDLSWTQDDYDTLQGFVVYRADETDGQYAKINQTLVRNDERSYRDDSVAPGKQYFYKFTVILDNAESEPSNIASATALDTSSPEITHTPIAAAGFGVNLPVKATIVDNIEVTGASLYHRITNSGADFAQVDMAYIPTSGRYTATIPGAQVRSPSVEYFISATDGATTAFSGSASEPYIALVDGSGDGDNDGVIDDIDQCLNTPPPTPIDETGCEPQPDEDGDGVPDVTDNCPAVSNGDQLDTDGDASGNACDADDDGDGYTDEEEIDAGTDPLDPNDQPTSSGLPIWLLYQATQ